MAKQKKGGLGRGLNSLLAVDGEATNPQEHVNNTINKEPEVPVVEPVVEEPVEVQKREEINSSIEEDKVTIKSISERKVERKPEPVSVRSEEPKSEKASAESETTDEVSIDMVHPNPNQPRTNFKKQELEELAESIKLNGLLQPILVRKKGDGYEIIAGERRWQASKIAGLEKVPVRIRDVDDDETIVLALIENIQRSDLNPIEEAYGYHTMMKRGNMTQTQVAQAVSKGRSTIANSLRLLELPEEAQKLLFEDKITAGHARAILSIPTKEGRTKLTEKLAAEQLSVRETEAIARLMSGKKDNKPSERPVIPKSYKTVARSLRDVLQTDVRIKSVKGKNKIEITFKDEADLERLFRSIAGE